MNKRLLTVLTIPALLLCSCKGAKITEEKAKEIATKITENEAALEDQGFEMVLEYKTSTGKGDARVISDAKYEFSQDKDENIRLQVKGIDQDKKYDFVFYKVSNDTYEEVSYIKEFNEEENKYVESVYTKKGNDDYSDITSSYSLIAIVPAFVLAGYASPDQLMEGADFKTGEIEEDGLKYSRSVNYYSTGDKNLTIESTTKLLDKTYPDDEEIPLEAKYSLTYDNLIIKNVNVSGTSNYDNKSLIKANLKLIDKAITLPNGWEKLLENK